MILKNKTLVQPKGYAITVASWENDADYNATKTMSGLTENQARVATNFAKLFRPCWRLRTKRGETSFDNLYEPSEAELADLYRAADAIIGDDSFFRVIYGWDDYKRPSEDDMGYIHDAVYELMSSLGLNGQQDQQFSRVAESIAVYYYPEDVYADDVTKDFL